tara:strand:- start:13760 stop:14707 length:948 start_codon:yes stop_codon:yes gene_type:complete
MQIGFLPIWIAYSSFDYNYPNNSILNIAYPSAIAYYFITIQPQNSYYQYSGTFLKNKFVYQSSLTVYDEYGSIDSNYRVITNNYINKYVLNVKNKEVKYVIIRYYCNLNHFHLQDYINNLPKVKDINKHIYLPMADQNLRNSISQQILYPFLSKKYNTNIDSTFSEFYYSADLKGLFPDKTHYYLFARPGLGKLFKIYGSFIQSNIYPYADFITVQGNGTQTENGIPFYDLPFNNHNNYTIYVSTPDISHNYIKHIDKSNNITILRWNSNVNIGLIFRIITYNKDDINNFNKTMTPKETQKIMTSGFYPHFEKIL